MGVSLLTEVVASSTLAHANSFAHAPSTGLVDAPAHFLGGR